MTSNPNTENKTWYNKGWLVILLCVMCFPVGLYALWKNETLSKGWKVGIAGLVALMTIGVGVEGDKSLPSGKLTDRSWICDGLPNNMYTALVTIEFQGNDNTGSVNAYEGSSKLDMSCGCDGRYELNEERTLLTITGIHNGNCPWMGNINGEYAYLQNEKAHHFVKGDVKIIERK